MKANLKHIALMCGAAVALSSCVVYDYPMYTSASVGVGGSGWSSSVSWTNASYDANGFPIFGYYYGQPVYGYTAAGVAVFSFGALTASCVVPNWAPAAWYCGHWHYPRHVRRVSCPPHFPAGHRPGVRPATPHAHAPAFHRLAVNHKPVVNHKPAVSHKPVVNQNHKPAVNQNHKPVVNHKPAVNQNHKPVVNHKPAVNHSPAVNHKPQANPAAVQNKPAQPVVRPQSNVRPAGGSGMQRPTSGSHGMQISRPANRPAGGAPRGGGAGGHSRGGHGGPRR